MGSLKLSLLRKNFIPLVPILLKDVGQISLKVEKSEALQEGIAEIFPETADQSLLSFVHTKNTGKRTAIKVGVLFSGGQAPGGHDVIAGIYDALEAIVSHVTLLGFIGGVDALINNKTARLDKNIIADYRGQGGFDLLGSGRGKLETSEDLAAAFATIEAHKLDGVIVIGGDDSNTNAAILAEYMLKQGSNVSIIGVPKTIDCDLKSPHIELSFGFDTATKVYSELIGNIARDAKSSGKYYHFIKLMGRAASHITLECAERCHPNLAFISEEISTKKQALKYIKKTLVDLIRARQAMGKNYGVILLPEGLIEYLPELSETYLSKKDPHGNLHVSGIATEELLIDLIREDVDINTVTHFLGYEGRSALPTNFDMQYCYALGRTAAILVLHKKTGYICGMTKLNSSPYEWEPWGVPIVSLLGLEKRRGSIKPVIKKSLVDLKGPVFKRFTAARDGWVLADDYQYPGPIQFFGPAELTESIPLCLQQE